MLIHTKFKIIEGTSTIIKGKKIISLKIKRKEETWENPILYSCVFLFMSWKILIVDYE